MIRDYTNTCFRYRDYDDHKQALTASEIGNGIYKFLNGKGILIVRNKKLPARVQGQFVMSPFRRGHIEYGRETNALILAHEGRHAWQADVLPRGLKTPKSPQDYVLVARFVEADARAIHFATTLEIVNAMRLESDYADILLQCLSPVEKSLYGNNPGNIAALCGNRAQFLQAARNAFDCWMVNGLASEYDDQIILSLSKAETSKLARGFFVHALGLGPFQPCFTETNADSALPEKLGAILGKMSDVSEGNYLLDTEGPALNDDFYTRICNYRVEKAVDQLVQRMN